MRTRSIGDFTVTAIGVGDVSLARAALRNVDAREVERALGHALGVGITLVQVAAETDAQALVGLTIRALRMRDRVLSAYQLPELPRVTPEHVQAAVESALRATKLDALPLAELELRPAWRSSPAWPELVDGCQRLVREGKVLRWGARLDDVAGDPEGAIALAAERWLATVRAPYSLCDRRAEPLVAAIRAAADEPPPAEAAPAPAALKPGELYTEASSLELMSAMLSSPLASAFARQGLLDPAAMLGMPPPPTATPPVKPVARATFLASAPLAGGALAGTIGPGVKLAREDDRRAIDAAVLERVAVAAAKLSLHTRNVPPAARSCAAAREVLEREPKADTVETATIAELALRFVLDQGVVALPRLHRHEHVIEAAAVAGAPPLRMTPEHVFSTVAE